MTYVETCLVAGCGALATVASNYLVCDDCDETLAAWADSEQDAG